jgi:uncharacterized repeat protein (TIGR01451 family)
MIVRTLLLLLAALAALGFATPAQAQLSFQLRTGHATTNSQFMPIDSNNCAGSGPRAAYVGGVISNSGAATVTNVVATISGVAGNFSLTGGQAATQSIGSIGAGQSVGVYWFVGYGCTNNATATPIITLASSAPLVTQPITLTAAHSLSASAGGNVLSSTLGPGAVVGQTIYFDATYDFGGSDVGAEFYIQPSGSQLFNAACFRLVGTEIRSSNIAPMTVGTRNQLYFRQTQKQSGNNYNATVRYYFEYQCAGASTLARPYALMTSGTQYKYTGNFEGTGSISITFPGATNPFTISKTSDISTGYAGTAATVKYTVTVTNPSAHDSRVSSFIDTLPQGATYVGLDAASNVTAANSSSVPAANATGTISFTGRQDQSYLLPAGGTVKLIYTVKMPSTVGTYTNSARATFGSVTTQTASVVFTVSNPPPLTLVKSSSASWDPLNGSTNPKLIPGARARYTITVANPNGYTVTANSIVILDATPAKTGLYVGNLSGSSGPVLFVNGSPSSGLTYSWGGLASLTDDIDFSNNGGATWTYVPTPDAAGVDRSVTHVRIRPKGTMAAGSSFSLGVAYAID